MFTNKKVLITGGTSGIGKAIAEKFLAEGATVIITSHHATEEKKQDLMKELQMISSSISILPVNISSVASIKQLFHEVKKQFTTIDILINCAGAYTKNTFLETTEEIWDTILDVDLKGTFFCTRFAVDIMEKTSENSIINIASIAGCYPRKTHVEYAVAKAGVIHLSKCLAQTLSPIRVNCLAPSYTKTDFMPEMQDTKWVEEKKQMIPLGDFNTPDDVADAVLFFASEKARMITGEVLIIDGGRGAQI